MNTKPQIPVGIDNFADLRLKNDVFVDKSMFIHEFLEDSYYVPLVARPGGWGKTLNIDMLSRFLAIETDEQGTPIPLEESVNRKLFVGGEVVIDSQSNKVKQLAPLKIAQQSPELVAKYQGKHPVISFGLKGVTGNSYQEIKTRLCQKLRALFQKHAYLIDGLEADSYHYRNLQSYLNSEEGENGIEKEWNVTHSLQFLSELLHRHFGRRAYILIDDYDLPVISSYQTFKDRPEEAERVRSLIFMMLGIALKSHEGHLKQGLLSGVARITLTTFSGELDNAVECTLLDRTFITAYGFREQEVDELLAKVPIATDRAELRQWYNGYTFRGETLYNPFSIMSCLANDGKLKPYWEERGGTRLGSSALFSEEILYRTYFPQESLQSLVAGNTIFISDKTHVGFEDFHGSKDVDDLLFFGGYLHRAVKVKGAGDYYEVAIPNHEARQMYERRLLWWVSDQLQLSATSYQSLVKLLAERQLEAFEQRLAELLQGLRKFRQNLQRGFRPIWGKEGKLLYSGLLLSLIRSLFPYYLVESTENSSLSLLEMVLIPQVSHGDQAMVIEHEVHQDASDLPALAQSGLVQLEKKDYNTLAKGHAHVKKLLQIFLAFSGKQVAMKYKEVTL